MVSLHAVLGIAVIAVCVGAAAVGLVAYRRGAAVGALVSNGLVLAQTLLIAQAAIGLLLLSDDRRAPERLHYTYGALALGAGGSRDYVDPRRWPPSVERWRGALPVFPAPFAT